MRLTMHLDHRFTHGLTAIALGACSHSSYRPAAATTHTMRTRMCPADAAGPKVGARATRATGGASGLPQWRAVAPRRYPCRGGALSNASGSLHVLARWSVRSPPDQLRQCIGGKWVRLALPSAAMREWRVRCG